MRDWVRGIAEAIRDAEDGDAEDVALAAIEAMRAATDDMECAGEGLEGIGAWNAMIAEGLA